MNEELARYHEDVAALRRYLVDAGLVTRERGIYRRVVPFEAVAGAATPAAD